MRESSSRRREALSRNRSWLTNWVADAQCDTKFHRAAQCGWQPRGQGSLGGPGPPASAPCDAGPQQTNRARTGQEGRYLHRPSGVNRWNGRDGSPAKRGTHRTGHRARSITRIETLPARFQGPSRTPNPRPPPVIAFQGTQSRVDPSRRSRARGASGPSPLLSSRGRVRGRCHQWQCGGEGRGRAREHKQTCLRPGFPGPWPGILDWRSAR